MGMEQLIAAGRYDAPVDPAIDDLGLAAPPGPMFLAGCCVATAVIAYAHSVPGIDTIGPWLVALLALVILALVWGGRLIAGVICDPRRFRPRWIASWLVVPTCGVVVLMMLQASVPLRLRFLHSRHAFEQAVEEFDRSPQSDNGIVIEDRRFGTYEITSIERVDGGYLFYEAGGAFSDDTGFAYLPDGPHRGLENGGFEAPEFVHLGGPWYAWTAGW